MAKDIKAPSDVKDDDRGAKYWLCEIDAAVARNGDWYKKAEEAKDRYKDKKERAFGALNIFWSNVETQKAALDDDFGKPEVRRINAPEDDGGLIRQVSTVLERSLDAAVRETDDNREIRNAVHDVLIPGRGQLWLELHADMDEDGNPLWVEAPLVRVLYEDYLEGPANSWRQVPWVARRLYFTLDDLKEIMGKERAKEVDQIPRNATLPHPEPKEGDDPADAEQFKRARVYEIWTKFPKKRRIYVAEGHDKILKVDDDPYRLKHFFPCPRPILANTDESWQEPLTDYSRYQDQAEELDRICERIYVLTEGLKKVGVYDKTFEELSELPALEDGQLLGVEDWASLMAKGGLKAVMEWQDLTASTEVLVSLHNQRQTLINLIYELSGISDLARGQTNPTETATAQKLKMTYGGGRFSERKKESRRFAAEAYNLKSEVIAEHCPQRQMEEMSGIAIPTMEQKKKAGEQLQQMQQVAQQMAQQGQQPPFDPDQVRELQRQAQARYTWEKISGVLRSDKRRCYAVETETDQTGFIDEEADKQARIEFIGQANALMQTFAPLIQGNPANGEVFKAMIMFALSRFKAGRTMEERVETAIDNLIAASQQQQGQQQPNPDAIKLQIAQVGLETAKVKLQTAQAQVQNSAQRVQLEGQQAQNKAIESQQKVQAQHDANQAKREGQMIDNIGKAEDLQFERATRATATEALLHGPTRAPTNGAQK